MRKVLKFYAYKPNKTKVEEISHYINLILKNKNIVTEFLTKLPIYDKQLLRSGIITNGMFVSAFKNFRLDGVAAIDWQQNLREIYVHYTNQLKDCIKLKYDSNSLFVRVVQYLVKAYNSNNEQELIAYFSNSKKEFHKKCLQIMQKFGNRLLNLVKQIQKRLYEKLKQIIFKSKTFKGVNLLHQKKMFEPSSNKIANGVINFKIAKHELIVLPCRLNDEYHKNMNLFNYTVSNNQVRLHYTCTIKYGKIVFFISYEDDTPSTKLSKPTDKDKIWGIDVNTKNNFLAVSDGTMIKAEKWFVEKTSSYDRKLNKINKHKKKLKLSLEEGERIRKRTEKTTRRSEAHLNLKAREIVDLAIKNGITHLVVEDLNIKGCKTRAKTKTDVNFNDWGSYLRINDFKNVLKRIANKFGIVVSFVDAHYTSKTCPHCGHISSKNRLMQETFSCVKCGYKRNADTNAARNIKGRITNETFCKEFEVWDNKLFMYKPRRRRKNDYIRIYKMLA